MSFQTRSEILTAVGQVTGQELVHTVGPRRAGDPPVLVADGTRAQDILRWKARRSTVTEIITDAWSWHTSGRQHVLSN